MSGDEIAYAAIQYVQAGETGTIPPELAALPQRERIEVLKAARRYVAATARASVDAAKDAMVDRLADVYERHAGGW